MARDSYEVYYFQQGRWQLHASFEANQRELAVEEAKTIETKDGHPSRVVRETFDPETNTTNEVVSWQSPKAKSMGDADSMFGGGAKPQKKKKGPPPSAPRAAPMERPAAPRAAPPKPVAGKAPPRKPKRKSKGRSGIVRFLIALAISFGLAGLIGIALALILVQLPRFGIRPPPNFQQISQGTFVLVFFLAFFINLQRQFNILGMLRGESGAPKQKTAATPAMRAAAKPKFTQDIEFDQVEVEIHEEMPAEETADEAPPELDNDLGAQVHDAEQPVEMDDTPAPAPAAVQIPEPAKAEVRKPEPAPEKEKAAPQQSPGEMEARSGFGAFIGDAVAAVPQDQLNAFSRFGMNLYLAGAASVIGQAKRLARDVQLNVLKSGLQSAGTSAERAEAFCVELPTYGKNPRYAGMVQAGAKAMTGHMSGARNAAAELSTLLAEWNLPEKRPSVPSVITFVFTDIVGSTAMTQRLGNAGAQKAVRAHNTAVRNAIAAKRGREVKHTGDGIMATFPDPISAVAGSIQMQRDIAAHNSANPNLEVMVRIGVNVGEAVEEDNDFFGAAVQMTARICDKATKGNIWVSQAIAEACKGQKIGFIPRGQFEMKGIQGRKTLYEVGWTDAHKNELADL